MSSAFESDASFPVLLAAGDASPICAIGVGVSSLRNRLRNPPLFFLSFSAPMSEASGCCGGGAHSSVSAAAPSFVGDSYGAGAPHGLASTGGFAVGAHSFAGASFEAGGAVIHDSAGAPMLGAL